MEYESEEQQRERNKTKARIEPRGARYGFN